MLLHSGTFFGSRYNPAKVYFFISKSKVMLLHRATLLDQGNNLTETSPAQRLDSFYIRCLSAKLSANSGNFKAFSLDACDQSRCRWPALGDITFIQSDDHHDLDVNPMVPYNSPYPVSYLLSIDNFVYVEAFMNYCVWYI
jgi:hypothetical protein